MMYLVISRECWAYWASPAQRVVTESLAQRSQVAKLTMHNDRIATEAPMSKVIILTQKEKGTATNFSLWPITASCTRY